MDMSVGRWSLGGCVDAFVSTWVVFGRMCR